MKYILVIGDGMSDDPVPELGNKTPLEYLDLPYFGTLAGSENGTCQTVPEGVPAGSDTAILKDNSFLSITLAGGRPFGCFLPLYTQWRTLSRWPALSF